MLHAEKYIYNLIVWWTSFEKKHLPEYVWESNLLIFWRERVLFSICCLSAAIE